MSEQMKCKWCGVPIKPWTDRHVDMAGGELCQDGGQEQFARRHTPAEPSPETKGRKPSEINGEILEAWRRGEKSPYAEPSPEVAPTQRVCFPVADFIEEEIAARGWSIPDLALRMGGSTADEVARDQLAIELLFACRHERNIRVGEEMDIRLAKAFGVSECFFTNLERQWLDSAPATQHRVIPVEWHRVAVEPTCPMCEFEKKPCPGGAHVFALREDGIRTVEDYAKMRVAQPANTDDRQADTIPDCWKQAIGVFFITGGRQYRYNAADRKDLEDIVRAALTSHAETRIEVLEAALRDVVKQFPITFAKYAALAAPSGEKEKV